MNDQDNTRTKEDAWVRVTNARIGCFNGNPTREYLMALKNQLVAFTETVDAELIKLDRQEGQAEIDAEELAEELAEEQHE